MKFFLLLIPCLAAQGAEASWVAQNAGTNVQFRGISAVSATVCWAAGSDGTYARTVDGVTWMARKIPGAEKLMFRSVVAWDANHATLLAIGKGDASRIYHTDDGGANWTLQFTNPDPAAFYDAIQFWDAKHGIAFSDPVDGRFRVLLTSDGGKTWKGAPGRGMPAALKGEGAFAASGTCLVVHGSQDAWIATGGASASRVFHSSDRGANWTVAETPISAGKDTAGIFGMAFRNAKEGIAVGGDYKDQEAGNGTVAATADGGTTWELVAMPGSRGREGLYEGAGFADATTVVVVGPTRAKHADAKTFAPEVGGRIAFNWKSDSSGGSLHACSFVRGITDPLAQVGWAAGDAGLICKWIWSP